MRKASAKRVADAPVPSVMVEFRNQADMVNCFLDLHKRIEDRDLRSFGIGNIIIAKHLLKDAFVTAAIEQYHGSVAGDVAESDAEMKMNRHDETEIFDLDAIAEHCAKDIEQMEKDKIRFLALG